MDNSDTLSNDDVPKHVDEVNKHGKHNIFRKWRQGRIVNLYTISEIANPSSLLVRVCKNNHLQNDSTRSTARNSDPGCSLRHSPYSPMLQDTLRLKVCDFPHLPVADGKNRRPCKPCGGAFWFFSFEGTTHASTLSLSKFFKMTLKWK
jgi:hypothetical protein